MATPFVLRFQEACESHDPAETGTITGTRIRAEQPDSDLSRNAISALPRSVQETGTQTKTAIRTEQADADAMPTAGQALLRGPLAASGTMTGTFIRAEEPDRDRDTHFPCVIRRCC